MEAAQIVHEFKEALTHAGITPREVSKVTGMSFTTIYRIISDRHGTTQATLALLRMTTKWLRWYASRGILADSPDHRRRTEQITLSFETWLAEV